MTDADVAIIGGGPAGSTCGTLLKKYNPDLNVVILEKEKFPREHVGESQLPLIGAILNEMGCYEKVDGAGFPIKLGATYRWGKSEKLWDFEFIPFGEFKQPDRPTPYAGQRVWTAFQVERATYDTILLDHAAEMGCDVRQQTRVRAVHREDDRVTGLELAEGETITAKHYVDASGHIGVLRRAMGVDVDIPTSLQNVAFWDYWENTEWAVKIGTGGTRVFVLSIGSGWIWFIPIAPTRTSIGFICPAEYYKQSGKKPDEIYEWALSQEPLVSELITNATREGETRSTSDWSFKSERMTGENWFLAGESAGFADPILAAGLTLTHAGARELAYVILELERGNHDPAWLREHFERNQSRRITQHIRFADFWYAGNGQFTDLEEHTTKIAKESGIKLDPKKAFQWLANGGFLDDIPGRAGIGGLDLAATKEVTRLLTGDEGPGWKLNDFNTFRINRVGAREVEIPIFQGGQIARVKALIRGIHTLPLVGPAALLVEALKKTLTIDEVLQALRNAYHQRLPPDKAEIFVQQAVQVLEVMLIDGWVKGSLRKGKGATRLNIRQPKNAMIHENEDVQRKVESA